MKLGGGGLLGLFLLFMLGMVMPWSVASCQGPDGKAVGIMQQSGFQVAGGEVEPTDDFKNLMKQMSEGFGGGDEDGADAQIDEASGDIDAAVWVWGALAGSALAAIGGLLLLLGNRQGAMMGLGGGALAVVVLVASMAIGFPMENELAEQNAKAEAEKDAEDAPAMDSPFGDIEMDTSRAGGFYLCLLAAAGQLAFAGIALRKKKGGDA